MIEFLLSNKEWIFSGIGVVTISTILAFFKRLKFLRHPVSTVPLTPIIIPAPEAKSIEEMSAEDIVQWYKYVEDPIEKERRAKERARINLNKKAIKAV